MTSAEEGFSKGAEGVGHGGTCTKCDKVLSDDPSEVIEKEVDGEIKYFCSEECADA
jgi:hypothetical protein